MNKLLIAGVVVSAGVVGYLVNQGDESPQVSSPKLPSELEFVPADTVVFSGQLSPFPLKKYLQATNFQQSAMPDELMAELKKESDPQKRFLASLLKTYFASATSAEQFQKTYGMADEMKALMYTVGLLPVIRYQVSDESALWAMLDQAETDSGFTHQPRTLKGLNYRAYTFGAENSDKPVELLVAQQDGWATFTMNTPVNTEDDLEVALALTKPLSSLADNTVLDDITARHGFDGSSVSFIDHQVIATALTTNSGNKLAEMITQAQKLANKNGLQALRNAECQKEIGEIASNWPRTSFGLYKSDITQDHVSMHTGMVIESKSSVVMKALSSIQGYLPAYLNEEQAFGMGIGIDADTLNPALASLWNNMLQPTYQCQPLQEMQASVKASNPAALAMFTGMVQGVKGVGVSLLDFTLDVQDGVPSVQNIEAIASLSATNPDVLFNMTKVFAPPLAQIELPTDGSPVDLSYLVPAEAGVQFQPMLAHKGEHLVLYAGKKGEAEANKLASEKTKSNGFMNLSMDYSRVLEPLLPVIGMSAEPEIQEQLQMLKNLDMQVKIDMRMNPQGVEVRTEMELDSKKK